MNQETYWGFKTHFKLLSIARVDGPLITHWALKTHLSYANETTQRVHWSGADRVSHRRCQNPNDQRDMEEIRDDYKFLRIQDAFKALHLHVNLIGVIVELGFSNGSGTVILSQKP